MVARAFAGDPAGIIFRRGDFAVERHGAFQSHQRFAGAHEMEERLVELSRLGLDIPAACSDLDARGAQPAQTFARDLRIGIVRCYHHLRTPAAISASQQGPVRPVCEQGSSVT